MMSEDFDVAKVNGINWTFLMQFCICRVSEIISVGFKGKAGRAVVSSLALIGGG